VLAAIDRSTTNRRRDYALLASMFNTGARIQEIVLLRVADLRLEPVLRKYCVRHVWKAFTPLFPVGTRDAARPESQSA
jgi:site-specific recombinase XerD